MAAIKGPSNRRKTSNFVEVTRKTFWIGWPTDELVAKIEDGIPNSADDSADSVVTRTIYITDCVVEGICADKSEEC